MPAAPVITSYSIHYTKLYEVKFLAIVSNNLDEFFMKRIGGLKQQVAAGVTTPSIDGRTPSQQLTDCQAAIRTMQSDKQSYNFV